jgi:hypothetical protein
MWQSSYFANLKSATFSPWDSKDETPVFKSVGPLSPMSWQKAKNLLQAGL